MTYLHIFAYNMYIDTYTILYYYTAIIWVFRPAPLVFISYAICFFTASVYDREAFVSSRPDSRLIRSGHISWSMISHASSSSGVFGSWERKNKRKTYTHTHTRTLCSEKNRTECSEISNDIMPVRVTWAISYNTSCYVIIDSRGCCSL